MACSGNKIDSNFTGLRYTQEVEGHIGVLPGESGNSGSPEWKVMEPNSYGDFGAQITTVTRTPITAGRQREKGVVTDIDASAGINVDFTQDNFVDLLQGFMFADWTEEKIGGAGEITGVVGGTGSEYYEADLSSFNIFASDLVLAKGFANPQNNGIKFVVSKQDDKMAIYPAVADETPPATATIQKIGIRVHSENNVNIDASGDYPALAVHNNYRLDKIGVFPGQWVYIGGDGEGSAFHNANNNGFARVKNVTRSRIEFDKTQNTMTTEMGGSVHLDIYKGSFIKNENDPSRIKCRSYQFERSLSSAGYEYVKGCIGNTFTLNVATADKINADIAFIGTDSETKAFDARKAGTFPNVSTSITAFNTSSDFSRIRNAKTSTLATPLFAFITEFSLTVNNNVSPAKAIGTLGAFDMNVGDFVAEGNVTAYFADVAAVQAIRDNAGVTMDFALAKDNAGWVFDIPLLTLGEGRLNVEKDSPITIPVSISGVRDPTLNTTLQICHFPYLPKMAEG